MVSFAYQDRSSRIVRQAPMKTLLSRIGAQHVMHTLHRHPTFAHSSRATLDRAGADISSSKDSRPTGFQMTRGSAHGLPFWRVGHRVARFDKSLHVSLDFWRQPGRARFGAYHRKERAHFQDAP